MNRRKKKKELNKEEELPKISDKEVEILTSEYKEELDNNPEFSLQVDPENKYNFSFEQKRFIEAYVQFKGIRSAAIATNIDVSKAMEYYIDYNAQSEIRRINRALVHRQFQSKLLSLDDIGGYLSSLITGENTVFADQLETTDKLNVVKLLIELNKIKKESIVNPQTIMQINIETQLKELSVDAVQSLLKSIKSDKDKQKLLNINNDNMTIEEKEYLKTLSTDELLSILNKKENKNVN